jgi:adenine-specific DNA methylase
MSVQSISRVEAAALQPQSAPAASPAGLTLLEGEFPYRAVSEIARRDRYCRDHVYSMHKWWARRPPGVIRALLLAAGLPAQTREETFWRLFASDDRPLAGVSVGDPFMGGATTLVEASRLGAKVSGIDVDPLAVRIARAELEGVDVSSFEEHARALLDHLRRAHSDLYPVPGVEGTEPLHYFWLRRAACYGCGENSLLYRNLWLVRDKERAGAVVRDDAGTAFCPDCLDLQNVKQGQKEIRCCGRRRRLDEGTYAQARFVCPCCGRRERNDKLEVGKLGRVLIAVEDTVADGRRRLRKPTSADTIALAGAKRRSAARTSSIPNVPLDGIDSGRPASYGFETVGDLFSRRQQVVFATAFSWVRRRTAPDAVRRALMLALSNALGSNNLLCGYATDYGRLSALFSGVRAYSMPVLSVEINPLHSDAGRGTLAMTLQRVTRSQRERVSRHTFDPTSGAVVSHSFRAHGSAPHVVACRSADRRLPTPFGPFDLVLTDPPYFDFIPYSDLSLLYRAWLADEMDEQRLGGAPIYPLGDSPIDDFAHRLGRAFSNVRHALKPGAPMTFTYHSSHEDAWAALGRALEQSGFRVSAVFPLWADGRSGGHGHAGNCEWDLVFVCRIAGPHRRAITVSREDWLRSLEDETIEDSDKRSMELGLAMAKRLST